MMEVERLRELKGPDAEAASLPLTDEKQPKASTTLTRETQALQSSLTNSS
jgi:hypothetical protein